MSDRERYRLVGRDGERELLDRLLDAARAGESQVLVLHGEPGIGKTTLLGYLAERSSGCRVVRASGAEAEMELTFAGLHQLCTPMLDRLDRLPRPQQDALSTGFGLSAGNRPDRFLVGLAVLNLISELASEEPLVCLIDDVQWLDRLSAQTLAFVARRLLAERVAMVFAVRDLSGNPELAGLAQLQVQGLRDSDARALLDTVVTERLDELVRDRIVAETRGNPLALLELPRASTMDFAGGYGRPDVPPLEGTIERSFIRRVQSLPVETQRFLLTAAAEPVGDALVVYRAAKRLALPADAAAPAVTAGLIELDTRVRFQHPLVRSVTYRSATPAHRREVHSALADATDPATDPDRRAWHRAHAAADVDEAVAAELVSSADRAQSRGGIAAAADFLRRATELTPDAATAASRALTAAQAHVQAGAFEPALKLLVTADAGSLGDLHQARVNLVRAQIAFASGHDKAAPRLLLEAARRLEPLDGELARATYRDAMGAAILAGGLADRSGAVEVAQAIRAASIPIRPEPGDLLLNTLAVLFTEGYAAAVPLAKQAMRAFRAQEALTAGDQPWFWLASITAADFWDDDSWSILTARHARLARSVGDLTELPLALNGLVCVQLFSGNPATAASLVAEVQEIGEATGIELAPYGALVLAAWRGDEAQAAPLMAASMTDVVARGEDAGVLTAHWTRALLMNGLARYDDAVESARVAATHPIEAAGIYWALAELIESSARSGHPTLARSAYERLETTTRASDTAWALGVLARSGALLATGRTAEDLYREAIDHLARTRVRIDLARAHLLYGEWLRREHRRRDARTQLGTAHDLLTAAGAAAFAERARRELAAAGRSVPGRAQRPSDTLTAQESRIAELAGSGLTNAEIGARLFLSRHTVEWHLRKVYTKLGITSRRQLRQVDRDGAEDRPLRG